MKLEAFVEHYAATESIFFIDGKILLLDNAFLLPLKEIIMTLRLDIDGFFLAESTPVVSVNASNRNNDYLAKSWQLAEVKPYLASQEIDKQALILKAHHQLKWESQSKFCGQCGERLIGVYNSSEKTCRSCQCSFFPRFSPAVMGLIVKDSQILLARSPHFLPGMYSALAGFVELGESAEAALHREVKEEVSIEISNLHYMGSQTWPFPDSFMIAFRAEYRGGTLQPDETEIEDANWFSIDKLPKLPSPASISRRLIDQVVQDIKNRA
jgi:NADH pyrophosphatase NudC (nudix superfamily)